MFNIGFSELAIICIVLIIAVGPERLPSMMKTLGKTLRTLRQASRDIRASTGIDELMREDFDIQPAPRRPFIPPPSVLEPPPVSRSDDVGLETPLTGQPGQPIVASSEATSQPAHDTHDVHDQRDSALAHESHPAPAVPAVVPAAPVQDAQHAHDVNEVNADPHPSKREG
jgi:sec-independent protein translocase protein TatB